MAARRTTMADIFQFQAPHRMKKFLHTTLAAALLAVSSLASAQTLLNASYDVAREFYKDYNAAFVAHYKKTTGKDIKIDQAPVSYTHLTLPTICSV